MNSPERQKRLRQMTLVCWVLWGALTLAMGIYTAIAGFLFGSSGEGSAPPAMLTAVLGGIALVVGVISISIPRFTLSDERLRTILQNDVDPRVLATDPRTKVVDPARLEELEALGVRELKFMQVPGLYFTPFIMRLVLNEAIAIFGFVLSFVSQSFAPIIPFVAVAFVLQLTSTPKIDRLLDRASRLAF